MVIWRTREVNSHQRMSRAWALESVARIIINSLGANLGRNVECGNLPMLGKRQSEYAESLV
jgi:hypothetical protein